MREIESGQHAWEQVNRETAQIIGAASEPRVVRIPRQIPPRRRSTYFFGTRTVIVSFGLGSVYVWGKILGIF